jgi:hypothetical protein
MRNKKKSIGHKKTRLEKVIRHNSPLIKTNSYSSGTSFATNAVIFHMRDSGCWSASSACISRRSLHSKCRKLSLAQPHFLTKRRLNPSTERVLIPENVIYFYHEGLEDYRIDVMRD